MNILDSLCALRGISAAGVCGFCQLAPFMSKQAYERAQDLVPNPSAVLIALFPYFTGYAPGNLSLYARGRDYHIVIKETLKPFAEDMAVEYGCACTVLADDSPLPEVRAARLSGVGQLGENGLIFDPDYGSYVFIGTILTDLPFFPAPAVHKYHMPTSPPDDSERAIRCNHCGACRRICPLGALDEQAAPDASRCLSALTQQGGALSPALAAAVAQHPLIWGCDLCQSICPLNRNVRQTENPDFQVNLLHTLTLCDIEGLTRRQFAEKYSERAFTWRGPDPLRRNLKLK